MVDWNKLLRAVKGQPEPNLHDFETLDSLKAWVNLHDELQLPAPNLCDDYSREARVLAEMDGYYLAPCLVFQGVCYGQMIFPDGDNEPDKSVYHIGNLAIVDDPPSCYYVDLNWNKLVKLTDFYKGGKY